MGIEFELKYRASEEAFAAIRRDIDGQETLYQMQTTYYDTSDGRLSARRWTLRRRMENERSVCTLKTPAIGIGRQEWEVDCISIEEGVSELCKLGCPAELASLADTGLIPICGARFTRIAKTIRINDSVLELALDAGVLTGGGREMPLREVEIELKSGSEETCRGFAAELASQYGLQEETDSKFRRALALHRGEYNGSF